jgi:hypothetical protein
MNVTVFDEKFFNSVEKQATKRNFLRSHTINFDTALQSQDHLGAYRRKSSLLPNLLEQPLDKLEKGAEPNQRFHSTLRARPGKNVSPIRGRPSKGRRRESCFVPTTRFDAPKVNGRIHPMH